MKSQMKLTDFFEGIRLMPEARNRVSQLVVSEGEYQEVRELFHQDRSRFYEVILKQPDFRLRFLYYFGRLACETYERYQEFNIEDHIFWDTFYDLTLWCENCWKEYGEYGINQYDWFFRHLECSLFRLGRLEFEKMNSEWELRGEEKVSYGEVVINVHIPQGERLGLSAVKDSFEQAFCFWGRQYTYICHSWLLYPGLKELMPYNSNILCFQRLFQILDTDFHEREGEYRIFTCLKENPSEYPEGTSLQKAAKRYLYAGNKLGNGIGIYKKCEKGKEQTCRI